MRCTAGSRATPARAAARAGSGRRASSSSATRSRASTASAAPSRACSKRPRGSCAKGSTAASSPATTRAATRRAVIEAINGVFGAAGELFPGFRRAHDRGRRRSPASAVSTLPRIDRPPRPPSRRGDDAAPLVWRDSLTTPRLIVDEVLREREAEAVAEAVTAEIAAGTRADEIYVLCRKRQSLRLVAARARAPPRRPLGGRGRHAGRDPGSAGPDRAARRARLDRPRPLARARPAQPAVRRDRSRPARASARSAAEGGELVARAARARGAEPRARARAIAARALARARRRAAAARPARSHRRRERRPRALRGRGAARAARVRARRDRRRARAIALSRRRPLRDALCLRARAQEAGA